MKILSKRAQEFLISPRHNNKNCKNFFGSNIVWDFSFESKKDNSFYNDNILTLSYFSDSGSELDLLFMEAIARLATGRSTAFLVNLSFRETENYLRDENHLPVFESEGQIRPELSFIKIKNSLLSALVLKSVQELPLYSKQAHRPWTELSLIEKNRLVSSVVDLLNTLFHKLKPMNLALAEGDEISLVMNEFPLAPEVIELVLEGLLAKPGEKTSLKVVAVQ